MLERLRDHRPNLIRRFGRQPQETGGLGHLREIRVVQVGGEIEEAGRLHFQLDKSQRVVLEDNDLDRQLATAEARADRPAAWRDRRLPTTRRLAGRDD